MQSGDIEMKELLQQCLDALLPHSSSHGNSWRAVEDAAIEALKQALAQQEQPASVDAYNGAREDAAIWKKRALEAEELNRKFIAELNGPTYLGEPAQQEQPAQEACWCDQNNIGEPGVSCGDCPTRDYKQPALSDLEIRNLIEKAFTDFAAMKQIPREALETDIADVPSLGLFLCRAIEAHCRGGAK